jgi:hypothetical protein
MLLKLLHEIESEGVLPNSFYKGLLWYQNGIRTQQQKKKTTEQFPRWISAQKSSIKCLQTKSYFKKITHHDQISLILGMQGVLNIHKSVVII